MATEKGMTEYLTRWINSSVLGWLLLAIVLVAVGCGSLATESGSCPNCDAFKCLSKLVNQSSCPEGTLYQEGVAICGCCPACVKFRSMEEPCNAPNSDFETMRYMLIPEDEVFESDNCAPGLSCQMDETTYELQCLPANGECFSYQYKKDVVWKPNCDPDGSYSSVQWKGDFLSGRGFCTDMKGRRIFGESWSIDGEDMTCACSREVASIVAVGERSDVSLHCTKNGNYEELQCDDGLCWCADSKTGLPSINIVPEQMVQLLPCFLEDEADFHYLRQCESASVAAGHIKDILYKHGTIYTNMDTDRCDPDGSYGNFQIDQNQIRCTWKDRSLIDGYASPINQIKIVNCNCARDTIIFEQNGMTMHLECAGNGNYNPKQFSEDKSFCVDSDGYPTTGYVDSIECT